MVQIAQDRLENLGPAERIADTLTKMTDHMVHNRPGLVSKAPGEIGARWEPCTWRQEGDERIVYVLSMTGAGKTQKKVETRAGVLQADGRVVEHGTLVGEYRKPGDRDKLFPEIAVYLYRQVARVFTMDNEFAAHWASYAFAQDNRDLKTVLAAFMLVQDRHGEPVVEDGEVICFDDDYRDVGEAMFLIKGKGHNSMDPKLILRVGKVLGLEGVAQINREMGFGKSARKAAKGRYLKAVTKWLRYRELNPAMLKGLVGAGMTGVVKKLARLSHYKPQTPAFFEVLGWDQKANAHRKIAIGETFAKAETFEGLDEAGICQRIVDEKIGYKRVVGLMPKGQEVTVAIMAACLDVGFSPRDYIIYSPSLEKFGLTKVEPYATQWKTAMTKAEDQRARNILKNAKSKEVREALEGAADVATAKAFEDVTKGLRVYCMVDKSSSMEGALEAAQDYLGKFLGGFPLDQLHVSVFSTQGVEIKIKAPKRAAVTQAFRGHGAGGGTRYAAGVAALQHHRPEEDEDVLFLFVGDQAGESGLQLSTYIEKTGLNPVAFGYLRVLSPLRNQFGNLRWKEGDTVQMAAKHMMIPCFDLDVGMFEADDPYAITRIMRDMIATTPVVKAGTRAKARVTLAEQILKTPLLQKPTWADVA